jgi:hypothetical protein
MENGGDFELIPIRSVTDFWALIDEFENDSARTTDTNAVNTMRIQLLAAFNGRSLYGLRIQPSESMYVLGSRTDPIFARDKFGGVSFYLLPCAYIAKSSSADISVMWIHTRLQQYSIDAIFRRLMSTSPVSGEISERM